MRNVQSFWQTQEVEDITVNILVFIDKGLKSSLF